MSKKLKKVAVIGHFAFGQDLLNGQTVKTKILADELERQLGLGEVTRYDTHGGALATPRILADILSALKSHENVIILPAHNGLKIIAPWISFWNRFYKRGLHYAVVGGWLPEFLKNKARLARTLRGFNGIYVETNTMKSALEAQDFENVYLMPNCKDLPILGEDELVYPTGEPYRLCTFSRVMKEKGIEDAVNAVKALNDEYGRTVFTLDIYGQVDGGQTEWFEDLKASFPEYINYGGLVPFDKSVEVLKDYYALLFPTFYDGEGFAGTLIDAFAAGVPVIATDWRYNAEIINDRSTGIIVPARNVPVLSLAIKNLATNHSEWMNIRLKALHEAKKYLPQNALSIIVSKIID